MGKGNRSRPSRTRGLKLHAVGDEVSLHVASFTDAWIETCQLQLPDGDHQSRPSRTRGLKQIPSMTAPRQTRRVLHGRVD